MSRKKNRKKNNTAENINVSDTNKNNPIDNMSVDDLLAVIESDDKSDNNPDEMSFDDNSFEIEEISEEESDAADNMIESIRQNAAELISDIGSAQEYTETQEGYTDGYSEEYTDGYSEEYTDGYSEEYTDGYSEEYTDGYSEEYNDGYSEEYTDDYSEEYTGEDYSEEYDDDIYEETEILPEESDENFSGTLDENPDAVVRSKTVTPDTVDDSSKGMGKRTLYAAIGVMFAIFTCIGISSALTKATGYFGSFTVNEEQMQNFKSVVYPAVIMDMPAFTNTYELTSEQVLTAAIWSMIMSDGVLDGYSKTFDVVSVPAVDVEAYAVKLFGEEIPALNHTTVGPAESRFYYNSETKSYNVPAKPLVYTYYPRIKSVSKVDEVYSIMVDYVNELPEWIESVSSKQVEFKLKESNGGYIITSLRVVTASTSL